MDTSVTQQLSEGCGPSVCSCLHASSHHSHPSPITTSPSVQRTHATRHIGANVKREGDAHSGFVLPPPHAWPESQLVVFPTHRGARPQGVPGCCQTDSDHLLSVGQNGGSHSSTQIGHCPKQCPNPDARSVTCYRIIGNIPEIQRPWSTCFCLKARSRSGEGYPVILLSVTCVGSEQSTHLHFRENILWVPGTVSSERQGTSLKQGKL